MDSLPFDFCHSVCSLFEDPMCVTSRALRYKIDSWAWEEAARSNIRSRIYVDVRITVKNNRWRYSIQNRSQNLSFDGLKKLDRRRLYMKSVKLTDSRVEGVESTFEEIKELARFVARFINVDFALESMGFLGISFEFAELLPIFQSVTFGNIYLHLSSNLISSTNEFLKNQLKSGMVRNLSVNSDHGDHTSDHRPILELFLLTKQFVRAHIACKNTPFDLAFLELLLEHATPCRGYKKSDVKAYFTCGIGDVRSLNPDQQISYHEQEIVWKRRMELWLLSVCQGRPCNRGTSDRFSKRRLFGWN